MNKSEILELLRGIERELVELGDDLAIDNQLVDFMPSLEQISENCELIADMVINSK